MIGKTDLYKKFYEGCLSSNKKDREFQGIETYEKFLNKNLNYLKTSRFNLWELVLFSPAHLFLNRNDWSELLLVTFNFIQSKQLTCSLNSSHQPLGFEIGIMDSWIHNGSKLLDKPLIEQLVNYGWIITEDFINQHLERMECSESWDPKSDYRWNFKSAYELWLSYEPRLTISEENKRIAREHYPKPNLKI